MELCRIATIKEILEKHGLRMQKSLGQNFLIDPTVPRRIAETVGNADTVLEIGPGIGCLTAELCLRVPRVVAVEIDRGLIPVLSETLSGFDNFSVINEDILKVELPELLHGAGRVEVCANLPYYITTPILLHLMESGFPFDAITVMVQSEVAARLAAAPGSADYGAVSVAVQAYGTVRRILSVPASSFYPAPKVDSAVIRIERFTEPSFVPVSQEKYRALVRAAFAQRRKKLANALTAALPEYTKEKVEHSLAALGVSADIRGDRLSPKQFSELLFLLETES